MPPARILPLLACLSFLLVTAARAQTVLSGLSLEFSKPGFTDPTLPQNQDRITASIWLTRGPIEGLVNAASECSIASGCTYTHNLSPAGTEWATNLVDANVGKTIAATNWAQLEFSDWEDAYNNQVGATIIGRDAVLHLIEDNIYLDIRFTSWSVRSGGGFTYLRAHGDPPPPQNDGDYNRDGVVDAGDYIIWRKTLSQAVAMNGEGADGNRNGTVDPDDYNVWRTNFGRVFAGAASGAGATAAVPEPATCGLIAGILALASWSRTSQRRS